MPTVNWKRATLTFQNFEDNLTKQLWQIIKQGYLRADSIDQQKMYYGALMGFVAGIDDPYTMFFDPELTKEFEIEIEGTFTGLARKSVCVMGR